VASVGVDGDIIPAVVFGELASLERAHAVLVEEREAILAAARAEAAALVLEARAAVARQLAAAQSEYATAVERGYAHGCEQARAEWMAKLAESADKQARLQRSMHVRLAELVIAATEQIVLTENREALFERALRAVEEITDGCNYLRVSVHPQDLACARAAFGRQAAKWRDLGYLVSVSVEADKSLTPGSCICESANGSLDASLETQLQAMRDAVSAVLRRATECIPQTEHVETAVLTVRAVPIDESHC
jgi:type III secretion protein L